MAVGEPCGGSRAAAERSGVRLEGGALNSPLPAICIQLQRPRDHL